MIELEPGKVPKRYARRVMVFLFATLGLMNLIVSIELSNPLPLIVFFVVAIPNVVLIRRQIRRSINPE